MADGGPVRAVIDLSNAMQERGHEISVACWEAPDAPEDWGQPGRPHAIEIPAPDFPGGFLSKPQIRDIRPTIRQHDVVHLHGIWEPITLQFARMAEHQGRPWVVSIRGMLDRWCMAQRGLKKRVYLAMGGSRTLNMAARVHLTAEAELEQSGQYFKKSTPVVIPNLLNLEPFAQMPPESLARDEFAAFQTGEPVLLFLSRIHYKKGIEHLLDAVAALASDTPAQAIIAGTGDEAYTQSLRDRARAAGVHDRVHFVGHVGGDLKLSLYRAADLFVLPTSQENFGFVFFEALAAGTPLVTTNGTDTWPELERSGAGEIVPLRPDDTPDPKALAERIASMLADRESLAARGQAGRDWVFENLDPARIADRFEQLYQDATA